MILMKNHTPLALCLIAGIMLVLVQWLGGMRSLIFLYMIIYSVTQLDPLFPVIDIIFIILGAIALLGGWATIMGGLLLTTSFVRLGKIITAFLLALEYSRLF